MKEEEETYSQETCVRISQLKHSPKAAAGCQVPGDEPTRRRLLKGAGNTNKVDVLARRKVNINNTKLATGSGRKKLKEKHSRIKGLCAHTTTS